MTIEEESAPPPSESDVLAILSSASGAQNSVTSQNLKKVQKQAKQLEKQKRKVRRDSNKSLSEKTTASKGEVHPSSSKSISSPKSLQISHGKPQSVTVNLLSLGLSHSHYWHFHWVSLTFSFSLGAFVVFACYCRKADE